MFRIRDSIIIGALLVLSAVINTEAQLGGGPAVGGWTAANTNDSGVVNASVFAVSYLAQSTNSPFVFKLGPILQASSQVVSGVNYNITLVVQQTNCPISSANSSSAASCVATSQKACTVMVWVQSWMTPPMKVTNYTCSSSWTTVGSTSSDSRGLFASAARVLAAGVFSSMFVLFRAY